MNIKAICSTSPEGLKAIQTLHPSLVFLDIEMPQMNGFEMLDQLDSIDFNRYVKGEGRYLIMSDDSSIDVSRSRKEVLM